MSNLQQLKLASIVQKQVLKLSKKATTFSGRLPSRTFSFSQKVLMENRDAAQVVGPFKLEGQVTKGFGRGSKELGIPTANFNEKVVDDLPKDLETGIYFGWTNLEGEAIVRKAVVSIGYNPFYENKTKSVETHIMWKYDEDFYDKWLKLLICGYIRPEKNYDSLQALIDDINIDIQQATASMDQEKFKIFSENALFKEVTDSQKL